MDIDLLFTDMHVAGLIANKNMVKKVAGILIDPATGIVTLEYADMDFMEMNIPVDTDYFGILENNQFLHIGSVKDGKIGQAYQAPLMFLDDPYRGEMIGKTKTSKNPLVAFERFIKSCSGGQPLHRDEIGDEDSMGCVLGDSMPSSLQFAPHLERRHALEAAPKIAPAPRMSGPGLGGSSGGGGYVQRRGGTTPQDDDD